MNLDEELRTTFASESERREPPGVDAHEILARGRPRRRRRTTLQAGAAAAVLAVIGIGAFGFTRADRTSTLPAIPPTPTTTAHSRQDPGELGLRGEPVPQRRHLPGRARHRRRR